MKLILNFKNLVIFTLVFSPFAQANAAIYGIYYFVNEVETFSPCKSFETYSVLSSAKIHNQLRKNALRENLPVLGTLFIKVEGEFTGVKAAEGYDLDYDGDYKITQVISIRPAKKSDCRLREQK